jgi:hypothetical protein
MTTIAVSILLCYGLADQLARLIGKAEMIVIVRVSSFLLVCIDHVERDERSSFLPSHLDALYWGGSTNMRSNYAWNRRGGRLWDKGTARIRASVILAQKIILTKK